MVDGSPWRTGEGGEGNLYGKVWVIGVTGAVSLATSTGGALEALAK